MRAEDRMTKLAQVVRTASEWPRSDREREYGDERSAEHRSRPRRLGGRLLLERGHRAAPSRRLPGHRAAIPTDVTRRRRRATTPGARFPGRPDARRRAFVRWPDHDR